MSDDIDSLDIRLKIEDDRLVVELMRRTDTGWREHISADSILLDDLVVTRIKRTEPKE